MKGTFGRRSAVAALVVVGLAWLASRELYYSRWMDDDAFISLRYARSLAQGHGLTFNPGERVEGYTNFLWTLLLAGCRTVGADLPTVAQWLGVLFSYLTLAVLYRFGRLELFRPKRAGADSFLLPVFAVLLLCGSESWAVWAVSGLENTFAGFLVGLAFLFYFRHLENEGRPGQASQAHLLVAAALFALAAMTHPSNALFLGLIGAHRALLAARDPARLRALAGFVVVGFGLYGAYFAWRYSYYGHPFPNTYYAKVGYTRDEMVRGLAYAGKIVGAFPLAFLALAALPIALRRARVTDAGPRLLAVAVAAYMLYVIAIGGEAFPAYRIVVVVLPLLCLIAQYELRLALDGGAVRSGLARPTLVMGLATLFLAASVAITYRNPRVRVLDDAVKNNMLGLYRTVGLLLEANLPATTLFAHSAAGVIAYYSEFRFIDTLGLTDAHIASARSTSMGRGMAGHEKGDGRYVFSRRPDYIMFSGYPLSSPRPQFHGDSELVALPEFPRAYRLVRVPFQWRPSERVEWRSYQLWLYQRYDAAQ